MVVVGLCLTGNLALATTTKAGVNARRVQSTVARRCRGASATGALQLAPREIEVLRNCTVAELDIFVARFEGDRICPPERLQRLRDVVRRAQVIQPDIPGRAMRSLPNRSAQTDHPTHRGLARHRILEAPANAPLRFGPLLSTSLAASIGGLRASEPPTLPHR